MPRRRWAARRCCCRVTAGRCAAWPGAPAARRATSRPPSPPGPTPSSPASCPSRRRTWRARPAWPSWPAATTPPSATARRRWRPIWRQQFGLEHRSSRSTTRHDGGRHLLLVTMGDAAASAPRSSLRAFRAGPGRAAWWWATRRCCARGARPQPASCPWPCSSGRRRAGQRAAGLPAGAGSRPACRRAGRAALGRIDARCGAAAAACIEQAVRWCGEASGGHRHRADPQGGAGGRRRRLSRPHRDAAGAGGRAGGRCRRCA
jgi:hypothetical protein